MTLVNSLEISNDETILVIPEIEESGDDYAELNSHVLVVNSVTGVINSRIYKQKAWSTDALRINSIEISYQPFKLNATTETIGITINYEGCSSVFPTGIKELTLFVRDGEELNPVLENFAIHRFSGETDGMANGDFERYKKSIESGSDFTNSYFDLVVIDSITNYQFSNGEEKNLSKKLETEVLKFENGKYQSIK